jgi:transposase
VPVPAGIGSIQRGDFQFLLVFRPASSNPQRRMVVISDNARYHKAVAHRAWREEHAAEFALDFLPPYSPELNPIERAWKLTRRLCLHNRYFDALEDVTTAVEEQFNKWTDTSQTLRHLCGIN